MIPPFKPTKLYRQAGEEKGPGGERAAESMESRDGAASA
jgi:hypothetical protein